MRVCACMPLCTCTCASSSGRCVQMTHAVDFSIIMNSGSANCFILTNELLMTVLVLIVSCDCEESVCARGLCIERYMQGHSLCVGYNILRRPTCIPR